jgi:hypothetical protein
MAVTMRNISLLSSVAFALTLQACGTPQPPDKPTWAEDVQPIIQANCASCHGASFNPDADRQRFDICDPAAFADTDYDFPKMTAIGASNVSLAKNIAANVALLDGHSIMPPPPASLPDYDRKVILAWIPSKSGPDCGMRTNNHKPTAKLVGKLNYTGGNLKLTVDVTDADLEPVLGSVSAGGAKALITHAGRNVLTLENVPEGEPAHLKISDGWGPAVEKDL